MCHREAVDGRPDVEACEHNQVDWFHTEARATGGDVWTDGPLRWIQPVPGGDLMLLFPETLPSDELDRGLARADAASVRSIGAWMRADLDAGPLAERGFQKGWAPHWMTARVQDVPAPADPRVALETATPEYDDSGRTLLERTKAQPPRDWHAAARIDGTFAGRAWAHFDGSTIGIYDMGVWPAYRRRGLGTELLRAVCAAAATSGANDLVLNATPEGERLYLRHGFVPVGDGITWWRHR